MTGKLSEQLKIISGILKSNSDLIPSKSRVAKELGLPRQSLDGYSEEKGIPEDHLLKFCIKRGIQPEILGIDIPKKTTQNIGTPPALLNEMNNLCKRINMCIVLCK